MSDFKSVKAFKESCNIVSKHFDAINKRSHSINNLYKSNGHRNNKVQDVWLPCCLPGIPCTSRINVTCESNSFQKHKELLVFCSEKKYCIHSTIHGTK